MIMGPWTHGDAALPIGPALAWFDRYLMGLDSAPKPPKVLSFEMPNGQWHEFSDWPPPGTPRTLTLNSDGSMGSASPPAEVSYMADPAAGSGEPRPGTSVAWTSKPLAEDLVIAGAGEIHLHATLTDPTGALASSAGGADTNFVFHLYDVAPDGTRTHMAPGFLKASHRASHSYRTRSGARVIDRRTYRLCVKRRP